MPTRDRPEFAVQAAHYFLAQDYPHRELIVVEQGQPVLRGLLPRSAAIRLVTVRRGLRIGALRNLTAQLARGDIVAQWDDDDWYGPQRLSRQVAAIVDGRADITALFGSLMLDLRSWTFWRCSPALHRRMFRADVLGGTLVYRRHVWDRLARYPDVALAEDAAFLEQALRRGARLERVQADGAFVYIRHGDNAWRFGCGSHLGPAGWQRATEPPWPPAAQAFYRARSGWVAPAAPTVSVSPRVPARTAQSAPAPLRTALTVTAIMPTRDRRGFVPQAIAYFLRQDHPCAELVIVDDGIDPVRDLVPDASSIVYHRLERPATLGEKRNLACTLAGGSVIAHWDDDDWSAPHRLRTQVAALERSGASVCGARTLLFYDPAGHRAWRYCYPPQRRPWVAGTTLCFTRETWARSPFPAVSVGEDVQFVRSQPPGTAVADVSGAHCVVAVLHRGNSAPKRVGTGARGAASRSDPLWYPVPAADVERLIGDDVAFYSALAGTAPTEAASLRART